MNAFFDAHPGTKQVNLLPSQRKRPDWQPADCLRFQMKPGRQVWHLPEHRQWRLAPAQLRYRRRTA